MDAMENLKDLQNSMLVRQITEEAAEKFCDDFERVEERLMEVDEVLRESLDEEDGEREFLRVLYPRTGGEIRVLLS